MVTATHEIAHVFKT